MLLSGNCPLCEFTIRPEEGIEESEILACPRCQSPLVVDSVNSESIVFDEAPLIEEDWGE